MLLTPQYSLLVEKCRSLPPAKGNYLVKDYVRNMLLSVLDGTVPAPLGITPMLPTSRCEAVQTGKLMSATGGQGCKTNAPYPGLFL
jgi:hypothetical protein